jgi:glycogen(starch) synthase
MNIILVSQEFPPAPCGGIGSYTLTMARALAAAGEHVHVIAAAAHGAAHEGIAWQDGFTVHRIREAYPRLLWHRPVRSLRLPERFPQLLGWLGWSNAVRCRVRQLRCSFQVDVVEAPDYRGQGLLAAWPDRLASALVRLHNPASVVYPDNGVQLTRDLRAAMTLERAALRHSDHIVSPSRAMARRLADLWGLDLSAASIIPCPVDTDLFAPVPAAAPPGAVPYILYAGRLCEAKGVRVLLRAAPLVLDRFPDVRFVLAGDETEHPELAGLSYLAYASQLDERLPDHLVFCGRLTQEELAHCYQTAALCVMPSLGFECFPYACAEPMACGCALVASTAGAIPEIVSDGINGLLVSPGDHVALAESIIRVLERSAFAQALGAAARAWVEEHCSIPRVTHLQLALYRQLARLRAPGFPTKSHRGKR